jgi:predicted CXXCH cytochrome family protein
MRARLKINSLYKLSLLLTVCLLVTVVNATEPESSSLGQVILPSPELPTDAKQCVEPAEVMRRDHMKFLMHQRDETVIDGIRSNKYSLTGCVNCHAQANNDGQKVRAEDPEYFCTECHVYTAVRIDCFECHSDQATEVTSDLDSNYRKLLNSSPLANLKQQGQLHRKLIQQVSFRDQL